MPLLIPAIVVIGGLAAISGISFFGYEAGQQTGTGISNGLTIIGIATGVGIVIYALAKSGKKI
jgi:hypothetical protein